MEKQHCNLKVQITRHGSGQNEEQVLSVELDTAPLLLSILPIFLILLIIIYQNQLKNNISRHGSGQTQEQVLSIELDTAPLLLFTLPILLTGIGAVLGQLAAQSDTLAVRIFFFLSLSSSSPFPMSLSSSTSSWWLWSQVLTSGLTNGTFGVGANTGGGNNVTVVVTAG